ncbi:MAG: hypothetical protein K0R57_2574 [Paenibacillaceae bacterium]|jgi:methyl-accepting chemotaxis protein|nr:hypothetical protein [Paenibacillaceae bacterium]
MRRSLRLQILLPFLALIIAASGLITYLNYRFTVNMTVEAQMDGSMSTLQMANQNLDMYLKEHERLVTTLAANDHVGITLAEGSQSVKGKASLPALQDVFQEALKADHQLVNVYGATLAKEMLVEPPAELPADFDPTSREWYKKAMAQPDKPVWLEPYIDTATKSLVLTVAQAVIQDGKPVGVVGADLTIDSIAELLDGIRIGSSGYVFVLDADNKVISHKDREEIGSDLSTEAFVQEMAREGASGSFTHTYEGQKKALSFVTNEKTGWKITGTVLISEFEETAGAMMNPSLISLIIVLVVAGIISWPLTHSIIRPVRRMQGAMKEFQEGKLSVRSGVTKRNEIGQLAQSFDIMAEQTGKLMAQIGETSDKLAESSQVLMIGANENAASAGQVAVTMQEIAVGASSQAVIVDQNAEIVTDLSTHIEKVEQEAVQMELLSAGMIEIAGVSAAKLERLSMQTQRSAEATESVSTAIASLDKSSEQIGSFVAVIAEITRQTNLLALNAAIEAARAGEHGRGFGVVAGEIRKLAAHSDQALAEIRELVDNTRRDMLQAASLTEQAGAAMSDQETAVRETNQSFDAINEAVHSHMAGISQVIQSVKAMTEGKNKIGSNTSELQAICQMTAAGTQEVSASVEQQTASMEQLNHLARQLEASAEIMRAEVNKFSW